MISPSRAEFDQLFSAGTLRCVNGRFRLASLLHIDVTDGGQVDLASEEKKFAEIPTLQSCVPESLGRRLRLR